MRRIVLCGVDEVPEGTMKMCYVDGTDQVLVVNTNGDFHALQGICSHEYFELDKGFLTSGTLTCALHLSRFDLESGEPLDPPAEELARDLHGRGRGRTGGDRGPGRPARDQRVGRGCPTPMLSARRGPAPGVGQRRGARWRPGTRAGPAGPRRA